MFRLIATIALVVLLFAGVGTGCGIAPARRAAPPALPLPLLRLAPASLPGGLALQQRLTFSHGERHDSVDALVEADAQAVRIVIHAQNQVALRVIWDGTQLQQTRADWLPPTLQAERVLSDLQLVFWPPEAIAAALPTGWQLRTTADGRTLRRGDEVVVEVTYPAAGVALLHNRRDGYELRIESLPVTP